VDPAEELGHHPDLSVSWNKVTVSLTTHAAGGLTANDFELARRIDAV
jgi:4a-hydroxytetrahydrobiopterin dehydratase